MAFCAEFLGMIDPDKARGGEGRSFLFSLGVVISQGRGAHTAVSVCGVHLPLPPSSAGRPAATALIEMAQGLRV